MTRFFTLISFVLISTLTLAQKQSVFKVLLDIDLTVSPPGRMFSIDTVINVRTDTSQQIGTWQKTSGKTTELRFKEGFLPTLTNFVFVTLPNFDNKYASYALLVRELDLTSAPDNTRFELAVTFSKRDSSQQGASISVKSDKVSTSFVPVFTADVIVEGSTNSFADPIKKGLAKAFLKFNEYLASPGTVPSAYSDFAIEAAKAAQDLNLTKGSYDSTHTDEDHLLRCRQFRPGVYQSFRELQQNRPSLTGALTVQEKNGFATLRKPSGSRAKHRFFGFSDGNNLFVSTGLYQTTGFIRRYAKVQSVGPYLLWINNYLTTAEIAANAAGASFGLIGALAASSANSYKDCIVLDMQTGGVFMVTKDKLPQMLAGHDDLLAELAAMSNKKNEQLQFQLLDKLNQRSRLATNPR